ncbi:Uncharacterised protein [Vibrio cholerae]|uniref:Uncharacterized protein n=1 Tax=Vibrio cholerae TaxID=666 RepID=A0A655WVI1_VIBCL|nr:Uncharacterised protein [Vibrio cholerae]
MSRTKNRIEYLKIDLRRIQLQQFPFQSLKIFTAFNMKNLAQLFHI